MVEIDLRRLMQKYCTLIESDLMRFWEKAFDLQYGGVYTCFSNDCATLLSTDKYVWSQGRMLWVLSRLCDMDDRGLLAIPHEKYAAQAAKTKAFLLEYALLPSEGGVCAYLLERDGHKKESAPGAGYYTSYFVDCFVIMGLMEYGRVFRDGKAAQAALEIYQGMMVYLNRGEIRSEPYPVRPGCQPHSKAMILTNLCCVCRDALLALEHPRAEEFAGLAKQYRDEVLNTFYDPATGLIREMIGGENELGSILTSHIAPGHANECMWFCMDADPGDEAAMQRIYEVTRNSLKTGWDQAYGGVFRFCNPQGGPPQGNALGDAYETLVAGTWDTKLWWVHAECLYNSMRCWLQTGEEEFRQWYQRLDAYVFAHFPNPDRETGEWIQILDRQGEPLDKVVALPVKDPYHILRAVMLMVELLDKSLSAK